MPQFQTKTYAFYRGFSDFEDLSEATQKWNLDLRQLDRGAFQGELLQFGVGGVFVSEARFGRSLLQKGAPPSGLRTIAIPASKNVKFAWQGIPVTDQDLVIFPCGSELDATSNPDFHVYTCSFTEELLANISESLDIGELDDLHQSANVIRCRVSAIDSLRKCLSQLCTQIRNGASRTEPELVNCASRDLTTRLLSAIGTSQGACVSSTTRKRELALVRAEAFVEQFAHDDIDVKDICRVAQVSQRTLEYAFVERFGLTPKAYLKAYRLNEVRRELRTANLEIGKVADIANRWGFWHMGQFAADYRAQFFELPSQTLGRRNSCTKDFHDVNLEMRADFG